MEPGGVLILVIVILIAVAGVGLGVGLLIYKAVHASNDQQLTVAATAAGRVVEIPVRQISRIHLSLPMLSLGRSNIGNHFRITPNGIEYKILFGKQVPFTEVSLIDVPYASRPQYLVVGLGGSGGIGVLTASPRDTHAALVELSRHCRLTPRAWQWLRPPPPPAYPPPAPQRPPAPQGWR